MNNVAQLIADAVRTNPRATFGTVQQFDRLDRVLERSDEVAAHLTKAGLRRGQVVAIIGANCGSYLVTWFACQLLGLQTALINPGYPDELLAEMLDTLQPVAVIWIRRPNALAPRSITQIDAENAWEGRIVLRHGGEAASSGQSGAGVDCNETEIAGYCHTSGTSGTPKFCALSHGYFIRLGRYFADVMSLSSHDTVVNPLPLFHINPIGNSVVGALTSKASFLSSEKFSAGEFWGQVKQHRATVLVLHGPPCSVLKAKTAREDAMGHQVRIVFLGDPAFLRQFDIPIGVGGYGSTEAGGYCHSWKFRPDDSDLPAEGALHLSGQPRHDLEYDIAADGEILVRGKGPCVLFSGYIRGGKIEMPLDASGWFHTGDRGRRDAFGNLIFIDRLSESIRVNAEYVPIDHVEERLRRIPSLGEFALWRLESPTHGHEPVVFTTASHVDLSEVRQAVSVLPKYMRPTQIIRIASLPKDTGVGKVQRRRLLDQAVIETWTV